MVKWSALRTGRLYLPKDIPGTQLWIDLRTVARPKGLSMKNSNNRVGNRTDDLLTCSAVPERTAPSRLELYKLFSDGGLGYSMLFISGVYVVEKCVAVQRILVFVFIFLLIVISIEMQV